MLQGQSVDMVISDMRMPQMDGATFLKQVKNLYPDVIRVILTGYAEREAVSRAFSEADIHEMISKPWDDDELKKIIRNALVQSDDQDALSPGLHRVMNKVEALPALPHVYAEVRRLVEQSDEVSNSDIAAAIMVDPAMAARILQIANSAFFGQRREIDTVSRALVVLGLEMVETLVLSVGVFQTFKTEPIEGFTQNDLWMHSMGCSLVARLLSELMSESRERQETAMLAASLHDLGKLVFAQFMGDDYGEVVRISNRDQRPITEVEAEKLGATHAEVGAYLADWWHLPTSIVEAIRYHYTPAESSENRQLAYLIHVSDFIVHRLDVGASASGGPPSMEVTALQELGISLSLDSLQNTAKKELSKLEL